jgi:hypothetical protein
MLKIVFFILTFSVSREDNNFLCFLGIDRLYCRLDKYLST